MIAVAGIVALVTLCGLSLWLQFSLFRSRERGVDRREQAWLSERKELLDRIMYLSERPWSPPPEPEIRSTIMRADDEPSFWPEQMLMEAE